MLRDYQGYGPYSLTGTRGGIAISAPTTVYDSLIEFGGYEHTMKWEQPLNDYSSGVPISLNKIHVAEYVWRGPNLNISASDSVPAIIGALVGYTATNMPNPYTKLLGQLVNFWSGASGFNNVFEQKYALVTYTYTKQPNIMYGVCWQGRTGGYPVTCAY